MTDNCEFVENYHTLFMFVLLSFLFGRYFLFQVTGLILLLTGILIKGFFREYEPFLDDKYFSASSLLIASGTIIFVIAFFGCYGAMRENRCMILTVSDTIHILACSSLKKEKKSSLPNSYDSQILYEYKH